MNWEGVARLADVYARFAEQEAVSRAPLYIEICRGVATDPVLLARLIALPLEKRQPNLLLAAVKYLFGTVRNWAQFRELTQSHWDAIQAIMMVRRTQTNEPARCATLLPLLALLPQPLALLEVGASAGLCLLPDKYAYDYGGRQITPTDGTTNAPVFACASNVATPIPQRNVEVVWRAGLDLHPLSVTNDDDVRWLHALVWPGEGERGTLLHKALMVARREPPGIVKGDLRHDVAAVAAEAPKDATLVIFHTAVLAYVSEAADRRLFAETVRSLGAQWVSNESVRVFDSPDLSQRLAGRFLLSLNGMPKAYTEAHGTAIDWIGP